MLGGEDGVLGESLGDEPLAMAVRERPDQSGVVPQRLVLEGIQEGGPVRSDVATQFAEAVTSPRREEESCLGRREALGRSRMREASTMTQWPSTSRSPQQKSTARSPAAVGSATLRASSSRAETCTPLPVVSLTSALMVLGRLMLAELARPQAGDEVSTVGFPSQAFR
jgi:hypothetical protein